MQTHDADETITALRDHVLSLLRGRNAHLTFEDLIADFPAAQCGQEIEGLPYTSWQVLEHMRIAQWDILEFSRNADHSSPEFPKGYWPPPADKGNQERWDKTVSRFRSDLKEMESLVADRETNLFARIPHGDGQTVLREALITADHNAYHLGALSVMSRMLKS